MPEFAIDTPENLVAPPSFGANTTVSAADSTALSPSAVAPDRPVRRTRTYDIDCTLAYDINGTTDFLFQIHALHGMDQRVLSESLVVTPPLPVHMFADPNVHHRFVRLHAERLSLRGNT